MEKEVQNDSTQTIPTPELPQQVKEDNSVVNVEPVVEQPVVQPEEQTINVPFEAVATAEPVIEPVTEPTVEQVIEQNTEKANELPVQNVDIPVIPVEDIPQPIIEPVPVSAPIIEPVSTEVSQQQVAEPVATSTIQNQQVEQVTPVIPTPEFSQTEPVAETVVNNNLPEVPTTPVTGEKSNSKGLISKIKSFGVGPIVVIAVVILLLISAVVLKSVTSTPKAIFKNAINKTYKLADSYIDYAEESEKKYDIMENAFQMNMSVKANSNIAAIEEELGFEIKDLNAEFGVGLDLKNEVLEVNGKIKGEKEELSALIQLIGEEAFISSPLLDNVVKVEEETGFSFEEFKNSYKEMKEELNINYDDYHYILKSTKNAVLKSLDKKYMEKENTTFKVDGKEIKSTKNSFIIDEDSVQEMTEVIIEELLNDDEFIDIIAKIVDVKKSEFKDTLEEIKDEVKDIEFNEEFKLNIYTKGIFNKIVGISFEYEGDEYATLFTNNGNIEFVIDNHVKDEYSKVELKASLIKNKKGYDLLVKYNDEKIVEGKFKELSNEVVDLDYEVFIDEESFKGNIYLKAKEEDKKVSGEYKYRVEYLDEYISLEGSYGLEIKDKLSKLETEDAISSDDVDTEKLMNSIIEKVENDKVFSSFYEAILEESDYEYYNFNSYDMAVLTSSYEVEEILSRNKAVIYVGSTYYSINNDENAYRTFHNLVNAQDELEFYSFYYNESNIAEMESLVGEIEYTCNTDEISSCSPTPTIYLIKEGKVYKAFRGLVDEDTLTTALKEIGY